MTADHEYKTTHDRTEEFAKRYCKRLAVKTGKKATFKEMVKFADSDFEVYVDGKFSHFLEVKFRRHNKGYYKQEKTPFRKHAFDYTIQNEYNQKCAYAIVWSDTSGILDISRKPDKLTYMVARYDRGNNKDLYALYNVENFKPLNFDVEDISLKPRKPCS